MGKIDFSKERKFEMNFEKKLRKERVIQFGEGGFLRGFADWMIQKLNDLTDFTKPENQLLRI